MTDSHAVVNLEILKKNLKLLKDFASLPALPAIKANAYGHGAIRVAKALENDVVGFAVATPFEALELREAGISTDIVLLTPAPPENSSPQRRMAVWTGDEPRLVGKHVGPIPTIRPAGSAERISGSNGALRNRLRTRRTLPNDGGPWPH